LDDRVEGPSPPSHALQIFPLHFCPLCSIFCRQAERSESGARYKTLNPLQVNNPSAVDRLNERLDEGGTVLYFVSHERLSEKLSPCFYKFASSSNI